MKRIILLTSLLMPTAVTLSMETPPIPNSALQQSEKSYLEKLPGDLQRYLIRFLASTETLEQAIKNIQSLASVNHHFHTLINNPTNMETIVKLLIQRFKHLYSNDEVGVIETLQKLQMPGLQNNPQLKNWLANRLHSRLFEMELEENLRKAATQGNLTLVTKLITQGVNINAPEIADEGKRTALMLASLNGHTAIVKALLDAGADASIKNYYGAPALMFAVGNHYADIVKLLLDARSNPNVTGEVIGMTPLMSAAASSHPASIEIMELLLNAGADIEMKDIRGENALDYARIHDNEQNAKFLKRKIKTRKAQAEAEKFIKEEIEKLKVKDARIKELEAEIERLLKERP